MTNSNFNGKVYEIDEVVDVFGKYQIIQYVLVCLAGASISVWNINYIFVDGEVDYRCRVPECDNGTQIEFKPGWWPNNIDRCKRPEYIEGVLPSDRCKNYSFIQSTEPCTDWIYETDESAISTLNLACQPWKVGLIGTVHSAGMFVSMPVAGWISDKFGRKKSVIICLLGGVFGIFKSITSSYNVYVALEFIEALFAGGTFMGALVLLIEISNKDKRTTAGVAYSFGTYFGETLFACIAMLARDWRVTVRIIYSPAVLFLSYIFLLKESPRWLIINGKIDEAKRVIKDMAKTNNTPINIQNIEDIDELELKGKFKVEDYKEKESFKKIFSSKEILKRLGVCAYSRFTASFVYFGLMINSVLLPGNKYTNFILGTVMTIPGEFIVLYFMNKIGRKLPCMVGFGLSGILSVLSGYTPAEYKWLKISLFLVSKMVIGSCFTGELTYSTELFPTSTRGTLMGMTALASRTAGTLAPLTPILVKISTGLPLFFFGGSAIIASMLLFLMPETRGMPLMDTIDQVDESVRNKKNKKQTDFVSEADYKYDAVRNL